MSNLKIVKNDSTPTVENDSTPTVENDSNVEELSNPFVDVTKSKIGDTEVNSVNLRDVWEFVESKRKFSDWVKDRLIDFEKGNDYMVHKKVTQYNQVVRIDYIVTIETAKMICMIERNAKGRQLRQYFIECERKLKERPQLPDNYLEALKALVESEEAKQDALEQVKLLQKTKHYISEKREATAMGTAGSAVKKVKKLEEEITKLKKKKEPAGLKRFRSAVREGLLTDSGDIQAAYGEIFGTDKEARSELTVRLISMGVEKRGKNPYSGRIRFKAKEVYQALKDDDFLPLSGEII